MEILADRSSRITTELTIACGMFKQGALTDEAFSLSALNASATRKCCPGQILMVKGRLWNPRHFSPGLSATLTYARICTLMSSRQAASMSQETVSAWWRKWRHWLHSRWWSRWPLHQSKCTRYGLVDFSCLSFVPFLAEFKPIRLRLRTDTPFILLSQKRTSRPDSVWPDMWKHVWWSEEQSKTKVGYRETKAR